MRILIFIFCFFCLGCSSTPTASEGGANPFPNWTLEFVKQQLGPPVEEPTDPVKKILKYRSVTFLYDADTEKLMSILFTHPKFRQDLIEKGKVFLEILPIELTFSQSPDRVNVILGRQADQISKSARLHDILHLHYFYAKTAEDSKKPDWRNITLRFANKRLELIVVSLLPPSDPDFGLN
ncbi:MAG: hypothetical protein AABZ60_16510 [Planctomycetota bacterium]